MTEHTSVPPTAVPWCAEVDRGTPRPRPACDRLPQGLFLGPRTPGVVGKLDRMARRQRAGSQLLAEWGARGGRVVVLPQQLALRGAGGRLVAGVLCGRAAIAHEYRQARHAAGLAGAQRHGREHGRAQGTTNAPPARAQLRYDRGCTVGEMMQALQVRRRTVSRSLAAEENACAVHGESVTDACAAGDTSVGIGPSRASAIW